MKEENSLTLKNSSRVSFANTRDESGLGQGEEEEHEKKQEEEQEQTEGGEQGDEIRRQRSPITSPMMGSGTMGSTLRSMIDKSKTVIDKSKTVIDKSRERTQNLITSSTHYIETNRWLYPLKVILNFPISWPRTSSLLFGVVIPLWALIALSMAFGTKLARIELPSEVRRNDDVLRAV